MKSFKFLKGLGLMVFIGTLLLGTLAQAQSVKAEQNVMMELEIINPNEKPPMNKMTQITYLSGGNWRSEQWMGEGKNKQLMVVNILKGGYLYMLHPEQKMAMKMKQDSQMAKAQQGGGKGEGNKPRETAWAKVSEELKAEGYTVSNRGKEQWKGVEYEVWRAVHNKDKTYVDYYLDNKQKMVGRWVYYDAKGKLQQEIGIIKYEVGKPLSQDLFAIPSDYQIHDMSNMQMPGGMKVYQP